MLFAAALVSLILLADLVLGCRSTTPPTPFEQKFYTVTTNPPVIITTPAGGLVTNKAAYGFTPNPNAALAGETAGGIANIAAPGLGGAVAGIVGTLFAAWGRIRSANNVSDTLAQSIETARELLKTVPNGDKYDAAFLAWLQKHQAETGTISKVAELVNNTVDNDTAKGAAQGIINLIKNG